MRADLRCVIDTSTLISALLSKRGAPNKVVELVLAHGLLFASMATFRELETRIWRPKFDRYVTDDSRVAYLALIQGASHFIDSTERIRACRDPQDDKFLELAVSAEADVLISSDNDLTALHPFRSISILKPREFLESEFVQA